jgi:hypothetical protein
MAAGSEITIPSDTILPLPSTTQIDVSLSETSIPTYNSIAALLIVHNAEAGYRQTSSDYGEQRPVSTGLYPIPELRHVGTNRVDPRGRA